jgi:hypothetical protein
MKREILLTKRMKHVSGCCPGHDTFPNDTYASRRSKKARARDKQAEHQAARSIQKRAIVADSALANVKDEPQVGARRAPKTEM